MKSAINANVASRDGTVIAHERTGRGPALILVDAAGHYREFSSFTGLIDLLAREFTVFHYDRRGRGASTDIAVRGCPQVDDLVALIEAAGGSAFVHAFLIRWPARAARRQRRSAHRPDGPARALIEQDEDRSAQRRFTTELPTSSMQASQHARWSST